MIYFNNKMLFSKKELACRCCGKCNLTENFQEKITQLRVEYGQPMKINSCFRCEKHNKNIGGARNSYHKKGMAFDVKCGNSKDKAKLVKIALNIGFSVGVYNSFIHLDTREKQILFRGKY